MTPGRSHRRSRWIPVLAGAALLVGAQRVSALEDRGDVARSVQEVRYCGNLQQAAQWKGSRWVCDGLEIGKAVIRRVGELVGGVDLTGGNRSQGNLVEGWGFSSQDAELLNSTFFANFYFPQTLTGSSGQGGAPSGGTRGAMIGPTGHVLQATTGSSQQDIQSWDTFLANVAPITKNPLGKAALFGLAALGRQAQLYTAFQEISQEGAFLPKFEGEEGQGTNSAQAPNQTSDKIIRPAEFQNQANNAAVGEGLVDAGIASANPPQTSREQPGLPSRPHDKEGVEGETISPDDPNKTGKGAGTADALATGQPQGGSGLNALACPTCSGASQGAGGVNSFLGGSPFSQALGRFGSGGLGGLSNLFNPAQFTNLLSNRFPQGGGGGGPRPTTNVAPPTGVCASQQAQLSPTDAQNVADVLGLPVTSTPWAIEYRSVVSILGTRGTNAETGQPTTITANDFPSETCVWAVTANLPSGTRQVVLASDSRNPAGTKLRLLLL